MYSLTVNGVVTLYDNEKEARKAFHNSVSEYGHENVMVTKEVA
jgi:hypothetical protein|tara:strand:+ start:189 stop:317 length:129 start_codon:yes stop_codon:yes gene_type:complete